MKKLKISSLSPLPLVLVLAIAAIIAVPLRTFQLSNCIDPETGFWLVRDFTIPILYALCGIVIVASFFISLLSGIMTPPTFSDKKDLPLGISSALLAVTLLVDAIKQMSVYIALFGDYAVEANGDFFMYILKSGALALTLQSIFGLIAALYLSLTAYSHFSGNPIYKSSRLLALAPVVWAICRMIYHFVEPISYKNVSQLLLELILLTMVMIFFLSFARIASDVNGESSMWLLWFSGVSGTFLGLVCGLAPLVLVITGKGDMLAPKYPLQLTDLFFAAFALCTLFKNMPRTVKNANE